MWTSVLQVVSVIAVQLAIIQMGLTHAPVTVATREMDEPAMVNKLIKCAGFTKKPFTKGREQEFWPFSYFFCASELSILKVIIL